MDDFVSYIFDIAQNSIDAKSTYLKLSIKKENDMLFFTLVDKGRGISKKNLKKITSPFYTTRTTRSIGLGLPLFVLLCEQTDGIHEIKSVRWIGTRLDFSFNYKHLDFPTEGDYGMLIADIAQNQSLKHLIFEYENHEQKYKFNYLRNNQQSRRQTIVDINNNINRIEENK